MEELNVTHCSLTHGVRQGGVLSPYFFAIAVDEMLIGLNSFGAGCQYKHLPVSALMYADDIILISASVIDAQILIDFCLGCLKLIDLKVNPGKSYWIRVGPRFNQPCSNLFIGETSINCSPEIVYLGSTLTSGSKFSFSCDSNKIKFFRNANKIFSKIGTSNPPVLIKLMESYCLSALLYNLEVFDLSKNCLNSLNFAWNRMMMKILKTSNIGNINFSLYNFGQLPLDLKLLIRKTRHLTKLLLTGDDNLLIFSLRDVIAQDKQKTIDLWCTLGDNLKYPCVTEAWMVFYQQLSDS